MNWTKDQKKVIDTRNCNLLVSAAAGSGKTAVLVERIIQMIFDKDNPVDIDRLLVVTFTKAAAAQMKEKISSAIEKKIDEEPYNAGYIKQLNLLRDANILTIDSFCYKVLKEYFYIISVDPKVQVADATELEIIKQEVLEGVMEDYYKNNPDFTLFSNAFSSDKNDTNIEDYIIGLYELSESYPFPLKWLENAKSNLHVMDDKTLSDMNYMKKYIDEIHVYASEIKDEVTGYLNITRMENGPAHYEETLLGDIMMLDDIISANTYGMFHVISASKFATLKRAKKSDVFDTDMAERIKNGRNIYKKRINNLLKIFSSPLERVIEQYANSENMLAAYIDAVVEFSKRYLERKLSMGLVGFSDVEHFALQILCSGTDPYGNPIPSKVGSELSDKFHEILIDEYQDSNFLQENILRCVSRVPCGNNNIFMVGDVKQSIYGFRMARPELFTEKYNTYKTFDEGEHECNDADSSKEYKIMLQNNFRSRNNILEYINYIFFQVMSSSIGGIDYNADEALNAGRSYPENLQDTVELLIGESKHYDFVNEEKNNDTEEGEESEEVEEVEEDVDISGMELEALMVADRIEKLMGRKDGECQMVVDEDTGKMRPLEYRDIVILFRSPKKYQPVFSEILMKSNIPVKLQNENGYFDMVEIRGLITLLKMIDNPYNDVECAALLRGYFGRLDSNELAVVILMKRYVEKSIKAQHISTKYLYSFVESVVKNPNVFCDIYNLVIGGNDDNKDCEKLLAKCINMTDVVKRFQKEKRILSITELIENIYYETDYYYYVKAMPQGKERSRNLTLFLDETKKFEHGRTRTLFDFLRFVKRISEKEISLGGDAANESPDNMVRIMSIHKSKGLEFPVVFVSGMGKQFNMTDTNQPLIIHSDYYICAKYVDTQKRCGNDTFMRKAVASLMRNEIIAEELRVLYVALTRAKEKLILTGVTSDVVKLINKLSTVADREHIKLPHSMITSIDSYLEVVAAAFIRNREFHKVMCGVKARYGSSGDVKSAAYEIKTYVEKPQIKTDVKVVYYMDMIDSQIDAGEDKIMERAGRLEGLVNTDGRIIQMLKNNLQWQYIDDALTIRKSKMSVTEIKRLAQKEDEDYTVDTDNYDDVKKYKEILPRFIAGDVKMDASLKGTWFHKAMELIDNKNLLSDSDVEKELEGLFESGRLPEETKEFITCDKICAFINSDLGKRMNKADLSNKLYKERKFVVGFPVKEAVPEVIVQGIIDAYFEENGKLVLLDYKTDKIKQGQEDILIKRYYTQLDYYKRTLEKITGMEVSETYLYSFALDKEIKM